MGEDGKEEGEDEGGEIEKDCTRELVGEEERVAKRIREMKVITSG